MSTDDTTTEAQPEAEGPTDGQRRALEAAEALGAEGQAVTARAVRERARVSMAVATEAATAWKKAESERKAAPPAPSEVQARIDALWPAAYAAAQSLLSTERDGLVSQLRASEQEQVALADALAEEEGAHEQTRQEAHARAARLQEALDAAQARTAELEQQLEAERARADRTAALEAQLAQLTEHLSKTDA